MKQWIRSLSDLGVSACCALALVGLIFPGHIFAQPRLQASDLAGLVADRSLHIEILEMPEGSELPTRFSLEIDDRKVLFEYGDGGYDWFEESQPEISGFRAVPDLSQVVQWKASQDKAGFFRASIPLSHFQSTDETSPELRPLPKLGDDLETLEEPMVETFGIFNPESKSFEMTLLGPSQEVVDVTISFAGLPADVGFAGVGSSGLSSKGIIIFIPLATVLIILGVAFIACIVMFAACQIACHFQCHDGLERVLSAICGVGCRCDCFRPEPPDPCDKAVSTSTVMSVDNNVPGLEMVHAPFTLDRLEKSGVEHDGTAVQYLMGEWALISYTAGAKALGTAVEVLSTSSEAFAQARAADLSAGSVQLKATAGRHKALIIATPDHGANSREIPLPELRLSEASPPAGLGHGKVLVRADFGENRGLRELTVLDDTFGGASAALSSYLENALSLDYTTDDKHRTVVFTVLEIGERLEVQETFTYLPKCCCGEVFCV